MSQGSHQPLPVGVSDGLGSVAGADLAEQVVDVAFTVVSLTKSRSAICPLVSPFAMRVSTSASRAVRPSGRWGAMPVSAKDRPAMTSNRWCWTAGSMAAWPRLTCFSASSISLAPAFFVR